MTRDEILKARLPPSAEPGTVLLETDRLMIRRYRMSDAPAMAEAANDPDVAFNLRNRFPSPYSLSDAEAFLSLSRECDQDGTAYPHHNGIFLKPDTPDNASSEPWLIGGIGAIPMKDVYYRTWEIGYWLRKSAWGRGYATEAVRAFVPWVFDTWPGLNRLEAATYSRNLSSQGVLRKSGFTREGSRRGAVEKNGVVLDDVIFGILRDEVVSSSASGR